MKRTPLYEVHKGLQAKMVEFAGFLMPVWYEDASKEHRAVREGAGIFDISHMGRVMISGKDARKFLQKLLTNDIEKLWPNKALYTLLCNEKGGVVDDIIIYQLPSFSGLSGQNVYLLVVNGACLEKDLAWIKKWRGNFKVEIKNWTESLSMIAIQGPSSQKILERAGFERKLLELKYFGHDLGHLNKIPVRISRTGYTGEDGFEIFVSPKKLTFLWQKLISCGEPEGLTPAGLRARDTLRFEANLPLYGQELTEDISPLQAGLERFVKLDKENFIGKETLLRQKETGVPQRLVGFEVTSGRIARHGYSIFKEDEEIGRVTSGAVSPTLSKSLGMGFVKPQYTRRGSLLEIDIRGQRHKAKVVKLPFYRRDGKEDD